MPDALSDARMKVDWARSHLSNLERLVRELETAYGDRVRVQHDEKERCHIAYAHARAVVDPGLALIVGDVIHSARNALDYIAWQLATKKLGREPTEREAREIQFPIVKNSDDFASSRVLDYICSEAAKEIERHQPYPPYMRGDPAKHPLVVLRWLSNRDKHRLIVATSGQVDLTGLEFHADPPVELRTEIAVDKDADPIQMAPSFEVAFARIGILDPNVDPADVRVYVDPQPPLEILCRCKTHWVGKAELIALVDRVEQIIDGFGRFL